MNTRSADLQQSTQFLIEKCAIITLSPMEIWILIIIMLYTHIENDNTSYPNIRILFNSNKNQFLINN